MKKMLEKLAKAAMFAVVAVVLTAGITGCSNSDDDGDGFPSYLKVVDSPSGKTITDCDERDPSFPADGVVRIPENITDVENGAFADCTKVKEVVVPYSVSTIKINAFKDCTGLEKVTFSTKTTRPESWTFDVYHGVKYIEASAFKGCTALKSIVLPCTLYTIG